MSQNHSGKLEQEMEEINSFVKNICNGNQKTIKSLGVSFASEDFEYTENYLVFSNLIMLLVQTRANYILMHDPKGHLKKNAHQIANALVNTINANKLGITTNHVTDNQIFLESTSSSGSSYSSTTVVFCSELDGMHEVEQFLEIQREIIDTETVSLMSSEDDVTLGVHKASKGLTISQDEIQAKNRSLDMLLVVNTTKSNNNFLTSFIAFSEIIWIPSLTSLNSTQIISCLEKHFGVEKRCASSSVRRPFDDSDKEAFEKVFASLVADVTQSPEYSDMPSTNKWLEKVLNYNVPFGKKNRGIAVVETYRYLMDNSVNDEQVRVSFILGWCLEVLQAAFLVADDIMDESEYRRGKLCWYRNEDLGNAAFNDAFFLESTVYFLLQKHFSHLPCFTQLLIEFHNITHKTVYGQSLDTITSHNKNLETYTLDTFNSIAKYKTAYYTFYAPVKIAMILAGIGDSYMEPIKDILLKVGQYFQVQDDYLDCFGDPKVTGKIGTDILDTKCTWLFVKAVEVASLKQRDNLLKVYGSDCNDKVDEVTQMYRELNLPELYKSYEEATYNSLKQSISTLSQDIPNVKVILTAILAKISKRQS